MLKQKQDNKVINTDPFYHTQKEFSLKVENMLNKYEWIASEKQFFGQTNTAYDFSGNDMKEVGRRLTKLQDTKNKLGKNVNMRAMNMMGKAEEKVRLPS